MNPTATVTRFLDRWNVSLDEIRAALRDTLGTDGVWDNVGMSVTTGAEEAMPMIDAFVALTGFSRMGVDMVNLCADGNRVFTERIDRFFDGAGKEILSLRVLGVFEVNPDGTIAQWRDYYDSAAMAQ